MTMKTKIHKIITASAAALLCLCVSAQATLTVTYGFERITANNSANAQVQLFVDVSEQGDSHILFHFRNTGPMPSSITDIYFDSGETGIFLTPIAAITSSDGVNFELGAAPPNLPGGNSVGFNTTPGLSADSQSPPGPNGVNPSDEWVALVLNLAEEMTFSDTITALNNGTLRIGLHVQGIIPDGSSDSFVNGTQVPAPATVLLMGLGTLFTFGLPRRRIR